MRNRELAADYVRRAEARLKAVQVLRDAASWADVVRESQEIVELALKGILRASGIEAPRIPDVSHVMLAERERLPASVRGDVEALAQISRNLRRDRELAFYGAEDLTPSTFYSEQDAKAAFEGAERAVGAARLVVVEKQ